MKTLLMGAAALLALTGPAFAQEAAPSPAAEVSAPAPAEPNVYQVLRTGDREMSCEALGAEANALNAQLMADAQKAQKGAGAKKFGRSVAGGVAGGTMKVGGRMMLGRVIGGRDLPPNATPVMRTRSAGMTTKMLERLVDGPK